MTTLTICRPEDKHERLKALAQARKMSVNKLIDELATVALANHDAFVRFQTLARQGDPRRALELLEQLQIDPLRERHLRLLAQGPVQRGDSRCPARPRIVDPDRGIDEQHARYPAAKDRPARASL